MTWRSTFKTPPKIRVRTRKVVKDVFPGIDVRVDDMTPEERRTYTSAPCEGCSGVVLASVVLSAESGMGRALCPNCGPMAWTGSRLVPIPPFDGGSK